MSVFGMFLVFVGFLIAATRGPFIVAPEATRSLYMRILGNDARMRGWGVFAVLLGALTIVAAQSAPQSIAGFAVWFGLFIISLGFGSLIAFPKTMRRMAQNVWNAFSLPVLRLLGVASVIFGGVLIYYGVQL